MSYGILDYLMQLQPDSFTNDTQYYYSIELLYTE